MWVYKKLLIFFVLSVIICGCSVPKDEAQRLYEVNCMNCHGKNGEGLRKLIPPLAGSDFLKKNTKSLACIIRNGMDGPVVVNGITFNHPMPGNKKLTDIDIHNILKYIRESWGNEGEYMTLPQVKEQLGSCE